MNRPIRLHISEIAPKLPAPFEQLPLKVVCIPYMPHSLRRSDIQPDTQLRLRSRLIDHVEDAALSPPERRGHHGHLAKHLRACKPKIKRDQTAKRRPAQARIPSLRQSA